MTLAIENVSVSIGTKSILQDINVDFQAGKLIALCGPNGAGKSTLLKAITAEMPISSGRILLHGEDMMAMSPQTLALKSSAFRNWPSSR